MNGLGVRAAGAGRHKRPPLDRRFWAAPGLHVMLVGRPHRGALEFHNKTSAPTVARCWKRGEHCVDGGRLGKLANRTP